MITVAQLDSSNGTVYLTSGTHYLSGVDTYLPLLDGSFIFTQTLYGDYSLEPQSSIGAGEVTAINLDQFDHLCEAGFDGRQVRLWRVQDEESVLPSTPTAVMNLTIPEMSWNSIRFGIESPLQTLDKPLQENVFEPVLGEQYDNIDFDPKNYTGGDPTLEGNTLPMLYGRCNNVQMYLLNKYLLLYSCNYTCDGEFQAVHQFWSVMSGGIRYEFQAGGNYPDVTSLMDATVQPGRYVCCLSAGLVRLGTPPAGTVTADVSSVPDDMCQVGLMVSQVLADFGVADEQGYIAGQLAQIDALCPLPSGIYVTSDVSVYDVVVNLLASVNAWISHDGYSQFLFGHLAFSDELQTTGVPVFNADLRIEDTEEIQAFGCEGGIPASDLTWKYSRNWTPMTDSDVGVTVSPGRKAYLVESSLSKAIDSPDEILERHLLAKPAEVETLLVGNSPIYLDNEGFEAGLIRWEPGNAGSSGPGTIQVLPIGEGVELADAAYLTQRIYLPRAVTGEYLLTVLGTTTGVGCRVSYWNGSAWVSTDTTLPAAGSVSVNMDLSEGTTQVAIRIQALAGSTLTARSVQISDPALTAMAEAEAARRAGQAFARGQCIQFSTPLDHGSAAIGSVVRVQDYRYGLSAGPAFQVVGKVQDWEGEMVTFRVARLIR